MTTVAFVPIKLNSQRLPHKNTLDLAGHPLAWHICNTLSQCKNIDEVYVFCSDEAVKKYLPANTKVLLREQKLDRDETKGFEIYEAFIKKVPADTYVLAHTTSPFLKKETIEQAVGKVISGEHDSAFAAKKIQTFIWYQNKPLNYDLNDVPRTQDIDPVFVETSGFYIFNHDIFTKHRRRIGFSSYISIVDDAEAVDIDTKEDFDFATKIAEKI